MTLNYMRCCKALKRGDVSANSKPHLWPRKGYNCYNGSEGADLVPASTSYPYTFPLLHYLALTLLRGNLLINLQLVSAARRLINSRRVARWRHAQNPPFAPSRQDLYALSLNAHHPACQIVELYPVVAPLL